MAAGTRDTTTSPQHKSNNGDIIEDNRWDIGSKALTAHWHVPLPRAQLLILEGNDYGVTVDMTPGDELPDGYLGRFRWPETLQGNILQLG